MKPAVTGLGCGVFFSSPFLYCLHGFTTSASRREPTDSPTKCTAGGNAPRRGGRGKNLLGLRRLLLRGNSEIFPPPIGSGFVAICYGRKSRAADAFRKKSLAKSCMVAGKTVPLPASLGQIFFPPPLTPSCGFARGHPQGERGRGAVTESALKIFATL